MTAGIVSISPDDLDTAIDCPAAVAVANLADIHHLPDMVHAYHHTSPDGRTTLMVALTEATAEQWRAAFGAPPFTARPKSGTVQHIAEMFWLGYKLRLSYSTY